MPPGGFSTVTPTHELVHGLSCAHKNGHVWSREAQAHASMCVGMHAWVACNCMHGGWAGGVGHMLACSCGFSDVTPTHELVDVAYPARKTVNIGGAARRRRRRRHQCVWACMHG